MESQWIADQLIKLTQSVSETAGAVELLNNRCDNLEDAISADRAHEKTLQVAGDDRKAIVAAAIIGAVVSAICSMLVAFAMHAKTP